MAGPDRPDDRPRPGRRERRRLDDAQREGLDVEWEARDARRLADEGFVGEGFVGEGFTREGSAARDFGRAEPEFDDPGAGFSAAPPPRTLPDLSVLLTILDAVRAAVPRELQQQFTALLREVLLALRALIDRYLERLDGRATQTRVEDIPID